ncbi:hypothetical protein BDZ89DRAFT_1132738 [Hymenopellis radicata]|nr:hypothetical protein BDZ89DRAFT_1132738 [Hymenopellis radicata]
MDNISAGLLARIGHWAANWKMRFHLMSDIYTPDIIDEVEATVRSFGPLMPRHGVQVDRFTAGGMPGFNFVTSMRLADALRSFYEIIPLLGAHAKLVPSNPLTTIVKIAIQSGAGRHVALFIDHVSPVELGRDFAWCGDHEVHVYSDRAVLAFFDIEDVLKAVVYMSTGKHSLPKKYTGALVSFAAENSIQETKPVPIAEGRY